MQGFPVLHYLLALTQTHVHWVNDVIQLSRPLLPPSAPALISFPASVFSNELALPIRWPKSWSFSISPSNEYSGLISFRIDRFDLLAVQGTLKNLLQHYNSKASILWLSAFFMVQLSHPFFWNSLAFSMIQQMLAIWSLVLLPLLNPACTSGSSRFTYCWSLAWRILSITLVACETSAIVC